MANDVEQNLIDAMRALRDRGTAHRTAVTEVMSKSDEAIAIYIDRLNQIREARTKLEAEEVKAFETLRQQLREQQSTLILVRDMHPVLVEMQGDQEVPAQKKISNGGKHK